MEPGLFPVFGGVLVAARQRAVRHDSGTFAPLETDIGISALVGLMEKRSHSRSPMFCVRVGRLHFARRTEASAGSWWKTCSGGAIRPDAGRSQQALKNEAGCESVAHVVRSVTDLDSSASLVSVE